MRRGTLNSLEFFEHQSPHSRRILQRRDRLLEHSTASADPEDNAQIIGADSSGVRDGKHCLGPFDFLAQGTLKLPM